MSFEAKNYYEGKNFKLFESLHYLVIIVLCLFIVLNFSTQKYDELIIDFSVIFYQQFIYYLYKRFLRFDITISFYIIGLSLLVNLVHYISPPGLNSNIIWSPLFIMASYYLAGDLVGKWICFTITVISLTFQFMKLNVPYTGVPFSHNELVSFNSYIIVIACYFTYFMTKKFSTSEKELIRIANESEKENLNSQKEIIGLLSILSHDISNPVTIIQSHLKRIDRSTEKEDQEIYIKKIEQKIEDMMTVLDEVKDLSLVKYGSKVVKLSEVNLPERLKKELMNYHEQLNKRNISVQKSWDNKDDFTILAENYSLNYVILNYLIGNAIDYCKENGCIKFSIFKNNKGVVLSIDITGNEIPSRLLGSNFFSINQANFFKQHFSKKGTGLSLPLCKEFLDLIDGKIVVSNSDVGIIIKVIFKDSFMDQKIAA